MKHRAVTDAGRKVRGAAAASVERYFVTRDYALAVVAHSPIGAEVMALAGQREVIVAVETRRGGRPTREVARPGKSPFTGRLIVLVDSRSASAAEMFARIVQIEARGTVVGDRTAGAVMRSHLFPHQADVPSAVYATSVTVADVRMSDGGSLERIGVEPDEIVLPRPSDLAAGRDPVLAHAIALAGGTITPEDAGRLFK